VPTQTEIKHNITFLEFTEGMKKAKEGKSSSMSGRHYSIYKALRTFPYT